MSGTWDAGDRGVLPLPRGARVRGRALAHPRPSGPLPDFALYLTSGRPPDVPWPCRIVVWRDFGLPADPAALRRALDEVLDRAGSRRVEIACRGGRGRTGTALACLLVLDGLSPVEAVRTVRASYHRWAVETPWQRRLVHRIAER